MAQLLSEEDFADSTTNPNAMLLSESDFADSSDALRKRLRLKDSLLNKIGYVKNRTKDDTPDEEGLTLDDYGKFVQSTDFNALDDERLADLAKQIDTKHASVAKKDTSGVTGVARNFWRSLAKGYSRLGTYKAMGDSPSAKLARYMYDAPAKVDEDYARALHEQNRELEETMPTFRGGVQNVRSVSDAANYALGGIAENLPSTVDQFGKSLAGGIAAGPIGARAMAAASGYDQNRGEAISDQIDDGVDKIDFGLARKQAIGYSIVDYAFSGAGYVGRKLAGKVTGQTLKEAKKNFIQSISGAAVSALKAGGEEAINEPLQSQVVGRLRRKEQTGSALRDGETTGDAVMEGVNEAIGGFITGFALGGGTSVVELKRNQSALKKADKVISRMSVDDSVASVQGFDKKLVADYMIGMSVMSDVDAKTQDAIRAKQAEIMDVADGKTKAILNAYQSMFTDASFDNIPDTVKPTFNAKKAYESKIEEQDGSETYFDADSGIMIQGREGAWSVFNRNGMKMPLTEENNVKTIKDAIVFAQNLTRLNQWRIENNQAKSEFIQKLAEKNHPGATVKLIDTPEQAPAGVRKRFIGGEQGFYNPQDNTVYMMLDAVQNPAQAAIILAHEDTHRGLMDVLKKGGLIEDGETVNEAKQRLFGADNFSDAEKSEEQIARTGEQWQGNRGKLAKMRDTMQAWLYQKTGTRTVIGNADVRIWLDTIEQVSKTAEGGKVEYQQEGQSDANQIRYDEAMAPTRSAQAAMGAEADAGIDSEAALPFGQGTQDVLVDSAKQQFDAALKKSNGDVQKALKLIEDSKAKVISDEEKRKSDAIKSEKDAKEAELFRNAIEEANGDMERAKVIYGNKLNDSALSQNAVAPSAHSDQRQPAQEAAQSTPTEPVTSAPVVERKPVEAAPYIPPAASNDAEAEQTTSLTGVGGKPYPTIEIPLDELSLSKDVPQFKENADSATGEVEPIEGQKYERVGTAPIVVWERTDGRKEIITGRHRAAFARRVGEKSIPAQVVREVDGFTKSDAITFDAESNIRDGQGSVKDYANYFRNTNTDLQEASSRGLLGRDKGRKGFSIGKYASDDLYSVYRDGKINDSKAAAISESAPNNPGVQQVGIRYAEKHNAEETRQYMRSLQSMRPPEQSGQQLDLLGFDTSWQETADNRASAAVRITSRMNEELSALKAAKSLSAEKRNEIVKKYGVKAGNEKAIAKRIEDLTLQVERFNNWHLNPDLVKMVAEEAGEKTSEVSAAPVVNTPPVDAKNNGSLFDENALPFNLDGGTQDDVVRIAAEKKAEEDRQKEAKRKLDAAPVLPGVDPVDNADNSSDGLQYQTIMESYFRGELSEKPEIPKGMNKGRAKNIENTAKWKVRGEFGKTSERPNRKDVRSILERRAWDILDKASIAERNKDNKAFAKANREGSEILNSLDDSDSEEYKRLWAILNYGMNNPVVERKAQVSKPTNESQTSSQPVRRPLIEKAMKSSMFEERGSVGSVDITDDWKSMTPKERQDAQANGLHIETDRMGKRVLATRSMTSKEDELRKAVMAKAEERKATPNVASATPNVSLKRGTKVATTRNADGVSYFGEVLQSNPDGTVKIRAFKEKTKGTIGAKGYGVDSKGNQVTKDVDVPAESVKSVDATADNAKLSPEEKRKLKMAEAVDAANADNELRKGSVEAPKDLVDSFNSAKERKEQRKTDNGVRFRRSVDSGDKRGYTGSMDISDIERGADILAKMPVEERDNIVFYDFNPGGAKAWALFEARKLAKVEGKLRRVTDNNTSVLWQDWHSVVRVGNEVYGVTKYEDPDAMSDEEDANGFPKEFVWAYGNLNGDADIVETDTADAEELVKQIRKATVGDVMFRRAVTPEQDAEYMAAVERGDTETAQRLVDEAAKKAGYSVGPVWHSSSETFNQFRKRFERDGVSSAQEASKIGRFGKGIFFSSDPRVSEKFGGIKRRFYLKIDEPTEYDLGGASYYDGTLHDPDTGEVLLDDNGQPMKVDSDMLPDEMSEIQLDDNGARNTGVIVRGVYESIPSKGNPKPMADTYVVGNPSQIKSADAVTRDDQGNVIPLSQRFNEETPDIRFRRASSSAASTRKALRNMSLASAYVRAYPSDSPDGRRAQATIELAYDDSLTPKTLQEMGEAGKRSYDADPQAAELALLAGTTPSGKVDEDAKRMARDKVAVNVMTERAIASGDTKQASTAMLGVWRWYERGTEVARALRMRFDPMDTPEGRKQFVMRSLLAPTDTDIIRAKRAKDTQAQVEAMKPSAVKALATLKKLRSIMVADKATGKKHSLDFTAFTNEQLMDEELMNQVLVEIATDRAGWGDKIHEFWRNSILSGVPTQVVNTLGNAGNAALEAFVQRPVQAIVNSFVGNPDAATKASVLAMWKAIAPSYKKANANFIKAWVSENSVTGPRSSKLDDANSAIQGRKGKIIRMPQRLMTATDEWFKTIFMSMLTADYATRKFDVMLKDGKVKESERDAFLSESMQVGTDAYAKAWEDALKWSFQQKNGVIAQGISRWRSDPNLGFVMKFIIPFVKTPANIVSTGMRKSPFGIPNAAYRLVQAARGNGDVNQAIELGAEQLVGMIVMASIWGLTQGDDDDELNRPRLTGSKKAGGKYRPGMRESEMRDYPPTSIRIGDKWISYARLEPFATVLSTMADVMTAWEQGKDGRYGDIPMTAFNSLKANFRDKTFLSGIGDIIEIMEDGDEKKLVMSLQKIASGFMPNLVRTTVRAFDPYIRDYRNREEGKEWGKTFGKRFVQASIPAKEIAPVPRYDIKGKPVEREGGGVYNSISPFRVQSADRMTKVDAMLKRYNDAQKDDNDRWMPSVPAMPKVKMLGKKDYIKLTDEEYAEYQQIAGQFADTRLGRMRFNLANPTERDVDRVKAVYEESREYAKNRIRAKIISRYRRELVK